MAMAGQCERRGAEWLYATMARYVWEVQLMVDIVRLRRIGVYVSCNRVLVAWNRMRSAESARG